MNTEANFTQEYADKRAEKFRAHLTHRLTGDTGPIGGVSGIEVRGDVTDFDGVLLTAVLTLAGGRVTFATVHDGDGHRMDLEVEQAINGWTTVLNTPAPEQQPVVEKSPAIYLCGRHLYDALEADVMQDAVLVQADDPPPTDVVYCQLVLGGITFRLSLDLDPYDCIRAS